MGRFLLAMAVLLSARPAMAGNAPAEKPPVVRPFETPGGFKPANAVDTHVLAALKNRGIEPAHLASDEVFLRRVYLDAIGTLPQPHEVRRFLADKSPEKRARLIEELLARPEFADYWSMKWCDLLRVKAEFPINLWPNAVQAYHRWVHDSVAEGKPYDRFARELLTSSGSNFRVPPVNFYRAVQGREPAGLAAAAALTFMGVRVESWPQDRRAGFEALFSRVAYKGTAEWKEEIVYLDPAPAGPLDAVLPDGTKVRVAAGDDPRRVFADWLIRPENPWFARNVVNRQWAWLMGRGVIHEPDDIRPDNPPAVPGLLDFLAGELVRSGYDLRHTLRLVLSSRTYQQSSISQGNYAEAEAVFACYPVRQMDAEVLVDALCWIFGPRESYSSAIPEPFTFIPERERTIALADGSINSVFLELFGRPPRDTGLASERNDQPTDAQRLHLINSTHVQSKIDRSWRLRQAMRTAQGNRRALVEMLYVTILSRRPTPDESAAAVEYMGGKGIGTRNGTIDLAWALVNSKEFLYRH